ncbi:MAG TPA: hypothetical protein VER96_20775 [Polyangiaceae bacterium]|nr:hypothetical protein [Polyangiaceae bacterium]
MAVSSGSDVERGYKRMYAVSATAAAAMTGRGLALRRIGYLARGTLRIDSADFRVSFCLCWSGKDLLVAAVGVALAPDAVDGAGATGAGGDPQASMSAAASDADRSLSMGPLLLSPSKRRHTESVASVGGGAFSPPRSLASAAVAGNVFRVVT